MDRERELLRWLEGGRDDLREALEAEVAAHVAQVRASAPDLFGYAVSFGVDDGLFPPFPITCRASDFTEHVGTDQHDYYRYAPNEWPDYGNGETAFPRASALARAYDAEFAARHAGMRAADSFVYDRFELSHRERHQDALLGALVGARARGAFRPEDFVLVWVSGSAWDEDLPIVEASVRALNEPEHVARYVALFCP